MCGISGVWWLDGRLIDGALVLAAANTMRHRGPDGEGHLLLNTRTGAHDPRIGPDTPPGLPFHTPIDSPAEFAPDLSLSQRRLAIIDTSPAGHEPMTVRDSQAAGRLWLTFNGEIYNYIEIRDDLRALGYTFHTECDAEVILQAYAAWGTDCLSRFVGMFAFALWDQDKGHLWCARDRFGVKPFYYTADAGKFAFASEMKALRVLSPEASAPDMTQLAWFLHTGGVFNPPYTFFEGIRELRGGHTLLVTRDGVGEQIPYWDVNIARARETYDYTDPEAELLRLMRDSVRLRLRADVPVGTCLSGGLDSSTIIALATEQLGDAARMNSFSSIYPVKGLDERRYIDIMAGRCGAIRHETTPQPDGFMAALEKITWHQDIPTASPTLYSQYNVMALAHGVVTVLLDGQGADELFGGYLSHVVVHLRALQKRDPLRFMREGASFAAEVYPRFFAFANPREFAARALFTLRHGRRPPGALRSDYVPAAQSREATRHARAFNSGDALNDHLYQSVMQESIPALLHYEDRNSMAWGIEARVPFLDHRVAEFALGVPGDLKVRGAETKRFARRAFSRVLPDEIAWRKDKLGYPTPFGVWLRSHAPLQNEARALLFDGAAKRDWCDASHVGALWNQHVSGQADHSRALYSLITAEMWLRVFHA
ncbi:MAG: asparagine synthase (glutamine-hydrolyzing) [Pleurocapsa minor GSE-CHR-MK-17-07R]|jgi:asparagine synthase (glutamine-hydrolysing)|nr:asparagine synthase (glutamine-hydrolyzing) [Pleurocapsa minor GSE-CHR-MK 17-07R]